MKAKVMEKMYHGNSNQRKAGMGIGISDNADFRPKKKKALRDKERHYIMKKQSISKEVQQSLIYMCIATQGQNT